MLLNYVRDGGNIFFALEKPDRILNPYLHETDNPELRELAGCLKCERIAKNEICSIRSTANFPNIAESWSIFHDEPVYFADVTLPESAEVIATADGKPLLYKHNIGRGHVYVFTWNLDLFMFKDHIMDHYDNGFDWIWRVIADDLNLYRDNENELKVVLEEIMSMPKRDWASMSF